MLPALTPFVQRIGDFKIDGELGRGGMSVVYRALRGAEVFAIKLMGPTREPVTAETRIRVRREAAAIARLNHPCLVKIYEIGELEGVPYIVMEYAEGACLDTLIQQQPLTEERVIALGKALASALVEVHRFGLVHRDIKPKNIVVSGCTSIKLIDFGLVQRNGEQDGTAGTLAYASPEQLQLINSGVDGRSDLYSLGVTLFECLTAVTPIRAETESEFLERLATQEAVDVRELRPETRPVLASIVKKLLAKDPDDRYQSARSLLFDLESLGQLEAARREKGTVALGARDRQVWLQEELPLIGRKAEAELLQKGWAETRQGRGGMLQIEGEGGSGKTRLVRDLVQAAQSQGAPVLLGKCQEFDTVPFGPLREAIDDFVAKALVLPEPDREAALQRIRSAAGELGPHISRLSAGLGDLLGKSQDPLALDPDAGRQLFYEAIAEFLSGLATQHGGALFVIDDVQWLDEGSLHVLELLGKRMQGSSLMMITMARNDAQSEGKRSRVIEAIRGSSPLKRIVLEPLDEAEVSRLIAGHLGGGMLQDAAVKRLTHLSRGNPFHVAEYVRALLDEGLLRPVAGAWEVELQALSEVTLPPDVIQLVVNRMRALGERTRRILALAGLLGNRFSSTVLGMATGSSREELMLSLDEAARNNLLERIGPNTYAFVHDRVREASLEQLSNEEQRDAHQAIAETLEQIEDRSAEHVYALARHYSHGHAAKHARRVCETSMAAGREALDQHAYEDAYELLCAGLNAARQTDFFESMAPELLGGLGRACVASGRLAEAFEHLETALTYARSQEDRFRLQYLLTLTYASQGRNQDALSSLWETFGWLGRPYPKSAPVQLLAMMGCWLLGLILRVTGIGFGKAKGEELKRRRILSELHYAGSMIALFEGRPVLMTQFIMRDFLNAHYLGHTGESAIAYSVYGAAMGLLQMKKSMKKYVGIGREMADQLGDRRAGVFCLAYAGVCHRWVGEYQEATRLMTEALPNLIRHQPGSWYTAMMCTEVAYSTLHAGHTRASIDHIRARAPHLERTNNLMFQYNTQAVLYSQLMITGENGEATELWQNLERLYEQIGHTAYARLARYENLLAVQVERGEVGPDLDENIERYLALRTEDYYGTAARIFVGYGRLAQYLNAAEGAERDQARKQLKRAIRSFKIRAVVPLFTCNIFIWNAAIARVEGRYRRAEALLRRADQQVRQCGSQLGRFNLALERARLARALEDMTARAHAQMALEVALEEGWRASAGRVRSEFLLGDESGAAGRSNPHLPDGTAGMMTRTRTAGGGGLLGERYGDALLQISLASTSTWDPQQQAQRALAEVARLLGAERALFFMINEDTQELELMASHQLGGRTSTGTEHYSTHVVRRVVETGEPVIVSGTEGGALIGSESVMIYDLRSVIAAPLKLRDRLRGVVYLHNSLAKGMFKSEHVDLLLAFANHIAIAVETARAARLEAQRRELQRDLELTSAVQGLLLPKEETFAGYRLAGAGSCESATLCGGDWWWHEQREDGSVVVVMGDVTGHGAPSAMVTATVAGAYQMISRLMRDAAPEEVLEELNRCIRALGSQYHMTMSITRLDPRERRIRVWNAGGPPVLLFRAGAKLPESVLAAGTPLGAEDPLCVGSSESTLEPGDRVLICTDGVLEMTLADGRAMTPRMLSRVMGEISELTCADGRTRFKKRLADLRGRHPLDDDATFVLVDCLKP